MSMIKVVDRMGALKIVNTDCIVFVDEVITKSINQHSRLFMKNGIILEVQVSIEELYQLIQDTK